METESEKRLSFDTPVEPETLKRLEELQGARTQVADRLLDLEQERIRLLRAATQIDTEKQRTFESILVSRGLTPNFPVEIDAKTGVLKLLAEPPTAEQSPA